MNRTYLTRFARALRETLGSQHLISRGRESGHCRRLRDVTPRRLVCALVESLGGLRVRTIADILRTFNAQNALRTRYKAFYNRLTWPEFPAFVQQVFFDILRNLSHNVLRPAARGKLTHFADVMVQDGSSFAVHDALKKTFGGRFTRIRPAAVEVHTFWSLFRDQVVHVEVAPDRYSEHDFLPPAEQLRGKLLLADRGYQSLRYWKELDAAGAYFVVRGKSGLHPRVLRVRGAGGRGRRFEGKRLRDLIDRLPRRRLGLDVEWARRDGTTLPLRMILVWVPPRREHVVLVTNVPRRILTDREVILVYRLRWQVELVFKEWKSYANLHEFASTNVPLVEGLIWASLYAAALKRSLAHAAQRAGPGVPISTLTTAHRGAHVLPPVLRCARQGFRRLEAVLQFVFTYLWDNASRAHPQRDRLHGRMCFGLDYVGSSA